MAAAAHHHHVRVYIRNAGGVIQKGLNTLRETLHDGQIVTLHGPDMLSKQHTITTSNDGHIVIPEHFSVTVIPGRPAYTATTWSVSYNKNHKHTGGRRRSTHRRRHRRRSTHRRR